MMEPRVKISNFVIVYMPETKSEHRCGPFAFEEAITRYEELKNSNVHFWVTLLGHFCLNGLARSVVVAHWEKKPETLAEAAQALLDSQVNRMSFRDLDYSIHNEYLNRLEAALKREQQ